MNSVCAAPGFAAPSRYCRFMSRGLRNVDVVSAGRYNSAFKTPGRLSSRASLMPTPSPHLFSLPVIGSFPGPFFACRHGLRNRLQPGRQQPAASFLFSSFLLQTQ